ncbi:hypothetical protein NGRA_0070 [Nosema granulosis]|uniref:J domain-containing protein n=1 Tax=Nosema granulosis TaxID=83296 RepID=A0A9P6H153_9MICR|nr:hypothetical protein NGRA_0070 [Nosema granulosis]
MFFVVFLLQVFSSGHDDWQNVMSSIKDLKNKTNFSTFYELFNVSEGASFNKIRKNYMSMIRSKQPIASSLLPKHEQINILTQGFNILRKKREAYDFVLSNSSWLYDDRKNYENTKIIIFLSILALLISLDIIYYSIRYIRYCNSYVVVKPKNKKTKGENKEGKNSSVVYTDRPQMVIYRMYMCIRSIFIK